MMIETINNVVLELLRQVVTILKSSGLSKEPPVMSGVEGLSRYSRLTTAGCIYLITSFTPSCPVLLSLARMKKLRPN